MGELKEVKVYLSEEDSHSLYSNISITSPEDAVDVMRELLGKQDREFFCVVNLDSKNRPINYHVVAIGTINACNQIFLHPGFCSKSASD